MNTATPTTAPTAQPANRIDPLEWETRVDLAACYRLVDHLRHDRPAPQPHFGARAGQRGAFPDQPVRHDVRGDHRVLADQGRSRRQRSSPMPIRNTAINLPGYVIHSAIHGARHDVGCVLHTHTNAGMAVSSLKCGLLPLTQTAMRWPRIAYHDFEGVVVDLDEQKRLVDEPRRLRGDDPAQSRPALGRPHHRRRRSTTSIAWNAPARPSCWRWPATPRFRCRRRT